MGVQDGYKLITKPNMVSTCVTSANPCQRPGNAALLGLALVIAVLSFSSGYLAGGGFRAVPALPVVPAFVWPPPPPLEPFRLTDADGQVFDQRRLHDKWTLLFFGYTHCPDICPTTLATLKQVHAALAAVDDYRSRGQVVFISVDGERDTPDVLKPYTAFFNPDFIAASGPQVDLHHLTRQFGMRIVRVSGEDAEVYWFDHPASVLLINPQARVAGDFVPPLEAADIAQQVGAIIGFGVPEIDEAVSTPR